MFKAALRDCPQEEVAAVTRIRRFILVGHRALSSHVSTTNGSTCPDLIRDAWVPGGSLTFCRRHHRQRANSAGLSVLSPAC